MTSTERHDGVLVADGAAQLLEAAEPPAGCDIDGNADMCPVCVRLRSDDGCPARAELSPRNTR